MAFKFASGSFDANTSSCQGCGSTPVCLDKFGCPSDRDPDFVIKRHDTKPAFKVAVEDCDGPLDIQGLVVEVNMWAKAKLKAKITETDTYFRLAGDVGFEQIMIGDIIIMDRIRLPEQMLVTAFDESNKLIQVQRGYNGTTAQIWSKGSSLKIFRTLNGSAETEMIFEDIENVDGTVDEDVLTQSFLVYEWKPEDTCLPGCYWLEFKVIKMIDVVFFLPGGNWVGEIHQEADGFYWTGTTQTDSSVRLSYDAVHKLYLLPTTVWTGPTHEFSGATFTGTVHNDGSVLLNQIGVPSASDVPYNEFGEVIMSAMACVSGANGVSLIPSFTDPNLNPYYFGCCLGSGVEWVRRLPACDEGFLIKIIDSPTKEDCFA